MSTRQLNCAQLERLWHLTLFWVSPITKKVTAFPAPGPDEVRRVFRWAMGGVAWVE